MGNSISLDNSIDEPQPQARDIHAPPLPQRIIGLTGGIGMGKTTISNYLSTRHHLPVLDADIYAREAVGPHSSLLRQLVERYGANVLSPEGNLNRGRLGEIVFGCKTELLWLEKQVHPYVRDRIQTDLAALDPATFPTVVVVIPLLFEARMTGLVTEIWVVQCERSRQVTRLQERDQDAQMSLEQIHARIDSQMPIAEKLRRADVVLDNNTTLEELFHQIDQALSITLAKRSG